MEFTNEEKLLQEVISKAWEDSAFKDELIANPIAAIEKLSGGKVNLPEGKTIVVRDQTDASTVYINIPVEQTMDDVELNEEQLEAVAGGKQLIMSSFIASPIIPILPPPPNNNPSVIYTSKKGNF